MGLTLTEKEYFKTRLQRHVGTLINKIKTDDITFDRDMTLQAYRVIDERFGLTELLDEYHHLLEENEELLRKIEHKANEIYTKLTGHPPEQASRGNRYYNTSTSLHTQYPPDARAAVDDLVNQIRKELEKTNETARRIAELRAQEATFIDRILTCSTHAQLQQLWNEVTNTLGVCSADGVRLPRRVRHTGH